MSTVDRVALDANISAIKSTIQCFEVAEEETVLKSSSASKDLRGLCPLPEHDGDSPSFYCYDNGSGFYDKWWCHRCNKGGDVIDLYAAMHGLEHNLMYALDALAESRGVKLWRDTDFMSPSQLTILKARKQAERRLADTLTSLAFSRWVMPVICSIEDEAERATELTRCLKVANLD